jgi:acyl-CoA thioesterase-1
VGLGIIALLAAGCGSRPSSENGSESRPSTAASTAGQREGADADAPASRPQIVILGDSLTAGLGLDPDQAFPALLQQRVDGEQLRFEVVNAGVSGDTSAGGLRRADWSLDGEVAVLVVALGANDGLRGLPVDALRRNLAAIIEKGQAKGSTVILAGMEAPPNLGVEYARAFHEVYPSLAQQYGVALVPFLLADVAGIDALNQADGIHPTAEGARRVADNVWAVLEPILRTRTKAA